MQTELICNEADGNGIEMNLLMVHAQDHLMTSILARRINRRDDYSIQKIR